MGFSAKLNVKEMQKKIEEFKDDDLKSTFESAKFLIDKGIDNLHIKNNLQKAETICQKKGFLLESDAEPFCATFLEFRRIIFSEQCNKFHKFLEDIGAKLQIGNRITAFDKLTGNLFTSRIVNGEFRGGCTCYMRDLKHMENIIENSITIYKELEREMETRGL